MGRAEMTRKKDERGEASRAIAKAILEQYKLTTTEEMQNALRDIDPYPQKRTRKAEKK